MVSGTSKLYSQPFVTSNDSDGVQESNSTMRKYRDVLHRGSDPYYTKSTSERVVPTIDPATFSPARVAAEGHVRRMIRDGSIGDMYRGQPSG